MIEIFFSENAALNRKLSKYQIGFEDEEDFKIEALDNQEDINEKIDSIIYLPFMLDIGDIVKPIQSDYRKNLFLDLEKERDHTSSIAELEAIWERYLHQIKRLEKEAFLGSNIRIWYSDVAYSRCGLYHLCTILKDYDCKVSVIKLPEYRVMPTGWLKVYKLWKDVSLNEFNYFLLGERELSKTEIKIFATMWEIFKKDNHPLRTTLEGNLVGVWEDFYDHFIHSCVLNNEVKVIDLIGNVISDYRLAINDGWYIKRIRHMIEQGELVVVKKNACFYEQILKKR